MLKKENDLLHPEFPTWTCPNFFPSSIDFLEKNTLWKITKHIIDAKNKQLFNCRKTREKKTNAPLWIRLNTIIINLPN